MKLERLQISVFLAMAVLLWWLVLLAQGTVVGWDHLQPFGIVVGFLVALGDSVRVLAVALVLAPRLVREATGPARHLAG